jgi:hypothetical protein
LKSQKRQDFQTENVEKGRKITGLCLRNTSSFGETSLKGKLRNHECKGNIENHHRLGWMKGVIDVLGGKRSDPWHKPEIWSFTYEK